MEDNLPEIDFESDHFDDIVARDSRYAAPAYALLMDVVNFLCKEEQGHVSGEVILDEFKERTLDQYGPLSFAVLREWGLSRTEDIGEMMMNLVEGKRVRRGEEDSLEAFANGYDFKEMFLAPYQT